MARATMRFDTSKFQQFVLNVNADIRAQSLESVTLEVDELKRATQKEVPRVTGSLADSMYDKVENTSNGAIGEVGYGGKGTINRATGVPVDSYIMGVHEDLDAVHPNGKAKFLEDPARVLAETYPEKAAIVLFKALDKWKGK